MFWSEGQQVRVRVGAKQLTEKRMNQENFGIEPGGSYLHPLPGSQNANSPPHLNPLHTYPPTHISGRI